MPFEAWATQEITLLRSVRGVSRENGWMWPPREGA